jgi:hypothetical protein
MNVKSFSRPSSKVFAAAVEKRASFLRSADRIYNVSRTKERRASPLDYGELDVYFGVLAGSAGRAIPHGSYFSLGTGMRSSAAL